jgi:hypothetical protein
MWRRDREGLYLRPADPFRTPNRFDLVRMSRPADSQSGIIRMGRGVHPAARRKVFIFIFFHYLDNT